mgnify:CR=1 FL=1
MTMGLKQIKTISFSKIFETWRHFLPASHDCILKYLWYMNKILFKLKQKYTSILKRGEYFKYPHLIRILMKNVGVNWKVNEKME